MPKAFLSTSPTQQPNYFLCHDQFQPFHSRNFGNHPCIPTRVTSVSQGQDRVENSSIRPDGRNWSTFIFRKFFSFRHRYKSSPKSQGDEPHAAYLSSNCALPRERLSQIPVLHGNRSTVVRRAHEHPSKSKEPHEHARSLCSPYPQTEPVCCFSLGGFFNRTKSPTLCNWRLSPRSMFTSSWRHDSNTARSTNQRSLKCWTPCGAHHPDRIVNAFVGSRLDLDKLCPESNVRKSGLFSPQSLESLIFEMMEKRAESTSELRGKRTSCSDHSLFTADEHKAHRGGSSAHNRTEQKRRSNTIRNRRSLVTTHNTTPGSNCFRLSPNPMSEYKSSRTIKLSSN